MDRAKAFLLQAPQPASQLVALAADDVRAEVTLGARPVPLDTQRLRHVQNDRDRENVVFLSQRDERAAGLGLDVGRVDDRQPTGGESLAGDVVQYVEGVLGRCLVVLVVGDEPAAVVRGDDLGRLELG